MGQAKQQLAAGETDDDGDQLMLSMENSQNSQTMNSAYIKTATPSKLEQLVWPLWCWKLKIIPTLNNLLTTPGMTESLFFTDSDSGSESKF